MSLDDQTYSLLKRLALGVVGVALYVAYPAARALDRNGTRRPLPATVAAFAKVLGGGAVATLALGFAVCGGPAPGESDGARAVRAAAASVIAALGRYAADHHGRYPAVLDSLTPAYLGPGVLPLAPAQPDRPVEYAADSAGYVLTFTYVGPGANWCEYRPSARRWQCGGLW